MKNEQTITTWVWLALIYCGTPNLACASDEMNLTVIVQDFLANAGNEDAHARFWADDLIYTSSAGLRFGKAEIMEGFKGSDDTNDAGDEDFEIVYSGVDMDVRVYDDTAIVAFKLVGTPVDPTTEPLNYFNTGTFLKRNGKWQVVAWQATKIPSVE